MNDKGFENNNFGKKNHHKVSLIVPCFNAGNYLRDFLQSLLSQTYFNVELIFVNDGSTDCSEEIFKEFEPLFRPWEVKYLTQSHLGQAAAVNLALRHVTGDYLMWSDADDVLMPDAISDKAAFLDAHVEYGMVRNDFYYCLNQNQQGEPCEVLKIGYQSEIQKGESVFRGIFDSTVPCIAGTYMLRTSLFEHCYPDRKIPLSDEGQNFQLLLPPASYSKCGFIDKPLMKYNLHSDSHSNRTRSLRELLSRAEGFYTLQKELLPHCECDREEYLHLAGQMLEERKHNIVQQLVKHKREYDSEM